MIRPSLALLFLALQCTLPGITGKLVGEPVVRCGTDGVEVKIPMEQPFGGHLFIRGHFGNEKCHKDFRKTNDTEIDVNFLFDNCGMRRKRQIECFYLEENHVVQSGVVVSPLPATEMIMQPPMPRCKYFVLKDGAEGESVTSLRLGDLAYHKWSCETEQHQIYCMRLHTCTADDGEGSMQQIVDPSGCSVDELIFPQVEYTGDMVAGVLVKAFKFADRSNMFFQCQIGLSLKQNHGNDTCPRPSCSPRRRRLAKLTEDVFDISAPPMTVFDVAANDIKLDVENTYGCKSPLQGLSVAKVRIDCIMAIVSCAFLLVLFVLVCITVYFEKKSRS